MTTASPTALEDRFTDVIAREVDCRPEQVRAADGLFGDGATIPFVARYRKEATGGLVDEQLEEIYKRRGYFLELAERRDSILESIAEQGKLTDELEAAIRGATSKQKLEDLYVPYKPKRRTRAQIARERGLEALAQALCEKAACADAVEALAQHFVDPENGVADFEAALAGARDILAEQVAEAAANRSRLRESMSQAASLSVQVVDEKKEAGAVYRDYFDYAEPISKIASHRLLAVLRGEREGVLTTGLDLEDEREIERLVATWSCPVDTPCGAQLAEATRDGYKRLLRPSIAGEVRSDLRAAAENEAIGVFRVNLEALLMQSPLGQIPVMGLDPAYRTGAKLAVCDATGQVVATTVIHPIDPGARPEAAAATILELVKAHGVRAIAVGNGTGSRETERFVRQTIKAKGLQDVVVAIVPETGASVYSASALARKELPDLDVSLRGAVSIARRMQDPLAELVKIEPKALGVGQYQHDVNQQALKSELDMAVETVVNRVGVELNTASPALLRRVSGLTDRLAEAIVAYRDSHGPFKSRRDLLTVNGFGPKTFELAAGFLRVRGGDNPLDMTAVHPERYRLVEMMAAELKVAVGELVGDPALVAKVDFKRFANQDEGLGVFTLDDIRAELESPGRDPRPQFTAPEWRDDVQSLEDVKEGLVLEGRVSNVTNFGAFVDIGVKRDGLVHVSELSHTWVADPREVVKAGQIVKVKVLEIDAERGRISLSMKALEPEPTGGARADRQAAGAAAARRPRREPRQPGKRPDSSARRRGGKEAGSAGKRPSRKKASAKKPSPESGSGHTTVEDLLAKWGKRH